MTTRPEAVWNAAAWNAAAFAPEHFLWRLDGKVATITLNRPERKNPLTFESYAGLRDTFRHLAKDETVKAVIVTGAGENFCSGGDVHEIIGPLVAMAMPELLAFTRTTGALVKAMRDCPQPIVAAVDGSCAGAGACIAMAADMRLGTERAKVAFLFTRVGLAGCDMGACAMLPRIIGQGRAAELLFTGRSMGGRRGRTLGLLQPAVRTGGAGGRGGGAGGAAGRRADARPRHHEDDAEPGMEHGHRRSHRGRGRGPGDLYADERLPARLRGLRGQAETGV